MKKETAKNAKFLRENRKEKTLRPLRFRKIKEITEKCYIQSN